MEGIRTVMEDQLAGALDPAKEAAAVPNKNGGTQPNLLGRSTSQALFGSVASHTISTMLSSRPLSPSRRVLFRPPGSNVGQGVALDLATVQAPLAQQEDYPARKPVRQLDFTSINDGPTSSVETSVQPVSTKASSPPGAPRLRPTFEPKEGTPKKCKQCNCRNSRCLKLYCECFASGTYCDNCNCTNCCNNVENEAFRKEAVEATLERNPNAFRPKIASSPGSQRENRDEAGEPTFVGRHNKGCNCKKSGCLKKYCECFQANILCSDNCKCIDCKNYDNSDERCALLDGDMATNLNMFHPADASGAGSLSYSSPLSLSKKRRTHDLVFAEQGQKEQGPLQRAPHPLQAASNIRMVFAPPNAYSSGRPLPIPSASRVSYSSLLMGVAQPAAVRELCKLLVIVSAEAARSYAEVDAKASEGTSTENFTLAVLKDYSSSAGRDQEATVSHREKEVAEKQLATNAPNANMEATESEGGADGSKQSAMSPGTLALMCDEQDSGFTGPPSPPAPNTCGFAPQKSSFLARVHVEQERAILSEFRDCLQRIVSVGNKRAAQYSTIPAKVELSSMLQMQQVPSGFGAPRPVMVAGQPAVQILGTRPDKNSGNVQGCT